MSIYASGKYAQAICDRCSRPGAYRRMVVEPVTNLFVHPQCLDKRVIKEPIELGVDAQALRHARPQEQVFITVDTSFISAETDRVTADA